MSEAAQQTAARLWGEGETFTDRMMSALREHGLPAELSEGMRQHLYAFHGRVLPHPVDRQELRAGTTFRMGGRDWETVGGEGHAPGHISFHDRAGRKFISGDQVLPDISPNIGWMPDSDPDPLGSYLHSLRAIQCVDADRVYPGHREPFSDLHARLAELLAHHERRLHKIVGWIGMEAATSFEVCEGLFGARVRADTHQLRFALAETIAHLIFLERHGKLQRSGGGDTAIQFRRE
jgi:glyoxylase-like metal-dependent hydrolase (beta-lactamase superfamily II)